MAADVGPYRDISDACTLAAVGLSLTRRGVP